MDRDGVNFASSQHGAQHDESMLLSQPHFMRQRNSQAKSDSSVFYVLNAIARVH